MSFPNRYFFYALSFALVIVGLATHSYAFLICSFLIGIVLALITEYFDNRRTEKYKAYNAQHHHLKHH